MQNWHSGVPTYQEPRSLGSCGSAILNTPLLPHDPRWLLQLQGHTLLPASKKDDKGHILSLYICLSVRVRMTQVLAVVWPVLPAVWPRGWLFHLCKHQLSRSRTQCFCLNFINQNLVIKLGSGKGSQKTLLIILESNMSCRYRGKWRNGKSEISVTQFLSKNINEKKHSYTLVKEREILCARHMDSFMYR